MNFDQVLELVRAVSDSDLTGFQYEEGNIRITMQAGSQATDLFHTTIEHPGDGQESATHQEIPAGESQTGTSSVKPEAVQEQPGNIISCPLVGRFYTAPSEESEDYVKVGDHVKKGQTLAIVEAMKLMNEIESEYDGVVTEILADNGQGVEYGQPLFRIGA